MATPTTGARRVCLIPWDPTNQAHYKRMHDQRIACGWKEELLPQWRDSVLSGRRCFYWITLGDGEERREEMLKRHFDKYEKEREPLLDTASSFHGTSRHPTLASFHPVGHVALEREPELDAVVGLDTKETIWVMSLYVSWALQRSGLGRAAMAAVEREAAGPEFAAQTIALDTVTRECQAMLETNSGVESEKQAGSRGMTADEWYDKLGYDTFYYIPEGECYQMKDRVTGGVKVVRQVCKKKRLG